MIFFFFGINFKSLVKQLERKKENQKKKQKRKASIPVARWIETKSTPSLLI
jgi:hypothetical protein